MKDYVTNFFFLVALYKLTMYVSFGRIRRSVGIKCTTKETNKCDDTSHYEKCPTPSKLLYRAC